MRPWRHFKTITTHRLYVMVGCFRMGLIWQGLTHDLSKYSPVEFWNGARYYQGVRSPNAAEREAKGASEAWMHHKGRNRHHYEYWTDMDRTTRTYRPVPVPRRYLAEMVADRIAACKIYEGKSFDLGSPLRYLMRSREKDLMHPQTRQELEVLLRMLEARGEAATYRYIRQVVLKGGAFTDPACTDTPPDR